MNEKYQIRRDEKAVSSQVFLCYNKYHSMDNSHCSQLYNIQKPSIHFLKIFLRIHCLLNVFFLHIFFKFGRTISQVTETFLKLCLRMYATVECSCLFTQHLKSFSKTFFITMSVVLSFNSLLHSSIIKIITFLLFHLYQLSLKQSEGISIMP